MARPVEKLDRGMVCVPTPQGNLVSWRISSDAPDVRFLLFRDGQQIASFGSDAPSCYLDAEGNAGSRYELRNIDQPDEVTQCAPWSAPYREIPISLPAPGYRPNDCSAGDLDGDGTYEFVLKWDPPHTRDNSHSGFTEEVFIDGYKLDGTLLWRINLGRNIRAGAHYTQFLVYDLDGDGKAEVAMRTAPGTIDGQGAYVLLDGDDPEADYRRRNEEMPGREGYVLRGPEYLTVFSGSDGRALASCPFEPARGSVEQWGDNYGNRVDRFLGAVALLDGEHPSIVMGRGYYQRSAVAAFDFDGRQLQLRWCTVGDQPGEGIYAAGNHNWSIADVDGDGCDEIIHGACALDHDGSVLYNTRLGHGDAIHLGQIDPSRPGLQVFTVHESKQAYLTHGMELHDALTGELLWGVAATDDNGRGMAADIDPRYPGWECWSILCPGLYDCKGQRISDRRPGSINFRIYWDGDLQDELLNRNYVEKWIPEQETTVTLTELEGCLWCNGTKATPCLQADLLGDWREEVLLPVKGDPSHLRLYSTPFPTSYRRTTLMHDAQYRLSIAWQNSAYNQPPHFSGH